MIKVVTLRRCSEGCVEDGLRGFGGGRKDVEVILHRERMRVSQGFQGESCLLPTKRFSSTLTLLQIQLKFYSLKYLQIFLSSENIEVRPPF